MSSNKSSLPSIILMKFSSFLYSSILSFEPGNLVYKFFNYVTTSVFQYFLAEESSISLKASWICIPKLYIFICFIYSRIQKANSDWQWPYQFRNNSLKIGGGRVGEMSVSLFLSIPVLTFSNSFIYMYTNVF